MITYEQKVDNLRKAYLEYQSALRSFRSQNERLLMLEKTLNRKVAPSEYAGDVLQTKKEALNIALTDIGWATF